MSIRLTRLSLKGFKTIRELVDFRPESLNVLIGANGAGKSNFISFFRLMSWMTAAPGNLQEHVALLGGANAILHDGAERTRELEADLTLETQQGTNQYAFRLFYAAADTLVFADERYRFSRREYSSEAPWKTLGAGHREAGLIDQAEGGDVTARTILALLRKCVVYQFHNTSAAARVRGKWDVEDSRWLKEDGANLASFLLRLRSDEPEYFHRITKTVRLLLPFFGDFELEPDRSGKILLQWREQGTDVIFNATQASDGMLRTMALVALLMQPESNLPAVLILDEPELGLHPYAIELVSGLIRSASKHSQVVVATQSVPFVNRFAPEDIVVVDRARRESTFRRLASKDLEEWLDAYSIGELWEKNVLGGRPV